MEAQTLVSLRFLTPNAVTFCSHFLSLDFGECVMEIKNNAFIFETALIESLIRRRRNRFIMEVEVDGILCDCHCPTTGSIGNLVLRDIPCLLSRAMILLEKHAIQLKRFHLICRMRITSLGLELIRMQ